ncbi:hypothetical protein V1512DRAFT_129470 [Lipomyces arxii]|uniref:uncharacterized protein n=1 Tax=Lipomyces arxii TaxID=56418 RepID=UPI0034CEC674
MKRFRSKATRWRKSPQRQITKEDVTNALPTDDDFRQSLMLPGLIEQFTFLLESKDSQNGSSLRDPPPTRSLFQNYHKLDMQYSMPAKASSVLTGTKQNSTMTVHASDRYSTQSTTHLQFTEFNAPLIAVAQLPPEDGASMNTFKSRSVAQRGKELIPKLPSLAMLVRKHLRNITLSTTTSSESDELDETESLLEDPVVEHHMQYSISTHQSVSEHPDTDYEAVSETSYRGHRRHTDSLLSSPVISIPSPPIPPKSLLRGNESSAKEMTGDVVLVNLPSETQSGTMTVPITVSTQHIQLVPIVSLAIQSASDSRLSHVTNSPTLRLAKSRLNLANLFNSGRHQKRKIMLEDISSPTFISSTNIERSVAINETKPTKST